MTGFGTVAQAVIASDEDTLAGMIQQWANNPLFMASAKVSVYTDVASNSGYGASGVLIASNWVLTAGHVITAAVGLGQPIQEIRFKMGPDALNPLQVIVADYWTNYPGYYFGTPSGQGIDLALVRLSHPVTNVHPAVLYTRPLTNLVGQACWIAAVGTRGIAQRGLLPVDYFERTHQNILGDCLPPSWLEADYLFYEFTEPWYPSALPYEGMGSPGNSGGPVWILTNSTWQVAGVISGGTSDPYYNYGNVTYAYPVVPQLDWIYGVIGVLPSLSIQPVDAATVRLQWPSWATSFALQTSTNLSTSNWTAVATSPTDDGTTKTVLATLSGDAQFWRLVKQTLPAVRAATTRPAPPVGSYDDLLDRNP